MDFDLQDGSFVPHLCYFHVMISVDSMFKLLMAKWAVSAGIHVFPESTHLSRWMAGSLLSR